MARLYSVETSTPPPDVRRCIVISGCSGGGKSTLLAELARRGHATVEEPGRRIVRDEIASDGSALPWVDILAFLHRAFALAVDDRRRSNKAVTFFDRGMVDAAIGLEHLTGRPAAALLDPYPRYDPIVFLAPPWADIFVGDAERRHSFAQAVAEYHRLLNGFPRLGYRIRVLPKVEVAKRADIVLAALSQ